MIAPSNPQACMRPVCTRDKNHPGLPIITPTLPEGMNGLELEETLRALKPGLKTIISSGYSAEIADAGVPGNAGIVYLPKPYQTRLLANTIRNCLNQGS